MRKQEENKSVGEIITILCQDCNNKTRHKVLTSVDVNGKEPMNEYDDFHWHDEYQIIQCQGCDSISFRNKNINSEDHYEEGEVYGTEMIFPIRTTETYKTKDFFHIPRRLNTIYKETIDCYNNKNLILCAAGVRALVEGLCIEKGVKSGLIEVEEKGVIVTKKSTGLQGQINGLYQKGFLTKDNADNLHEHRFLGNTALHRMSAPAKKDLLLAIEIVEHTFETLYEIPAKAAELRHKRLGTSPEF